MKILITGTSKGIGLDLVRFFLKKEDSEIVAIVRLEESRDSLKNEFPQDFNKKLFVEVTDIREISESFQETLFSKLKHLDILINNAGYLVNKDFEHLNENDYRESFDINFYGSARIIQICLPLLKKSKLSHVINISSMGGFQGSSKFSGLSFYSSSKAALASLTECLAEEYKNTNIRFNCLALGAVQTEMLSSAFPEYKAPLNSKEMSEFIGEFAINSHKYFNGKILPVALSNP